MKLPSPSSRTRLVLCSFVLLCGPNLFVSSTPVGPSASDLARFLGQSPLTDTFGAIPSPLPGLDGFTLHDLLASPTGAVGLFANRSLTNLTLPSLNFTASNLWNAATGSAGRPIVAALQQLTGDLPYINVSLPSLFNSAAGQEGFLPALLLQLGSEIPAINYSFPIGWPNPKIFYPSTAIPSLSFGLPQTIEAAIGPGGRPIPAALLEQLTGFNVSLPPVLSTATGPWGKPIPAALLEQLGNNLAGLNVALPPLFNTVTGPGGRPTPAALLEQLGNGLTGFNVSLPLFKIATGPGGKPIPAVLLEHLGNDLGNAPLPPMLFPATWPGGRTIQAALLEQLGNNLAGLNVSLPPLFNTAIGPGGRPIPSALLEQLGSSLAGLNVSLPPLFNTAIGPGGRPIPAALLEQLGSNLAGSNGPLPPLFNTATGGGRPIPATLLENLRWPLPQHWSPSDATLSMFSPNSFPSSPFSTFLPSDLDNIALTPTLPSPSDLWHAFRGTSPDGSLTQRRKLSGDESSRTTAEEDRAVGIASLEYSGTPTIPGEGTPLLRGKAGRV